MIGSKENVKIYEIWDQFDNNCRTAKEINVEKAKINDNLIEAKWVVLFCTFQ